MYNPISYITTGLWWRSIIHIFPIFSTRLLLSPFLSFSPCSRNSDPGSHISSRLFFPLLTTVRDFNFYRENDSESALASLVHSRQIVPIHGIIEGKAFHGVEPHGGAVFRNDTARFGVGLSFGNRAVRCGAVRCGAVRFNFF